MTKCDGSLIALLEHPWPEQNDFGRGYNHLRDLALDALNNTPPAEAQPDTATAALMAVNMAEKASLLVLELERLRDEAAHSDMLAEALRKYGGHTASCLYWDHLTGGLCNCGFNKALSRHDKRKGK